MVNVFARLQFCFSWLLTLAERNFFTEKLDSDTQKRGYYFYRYRKLYDSLCTFLIAIQTEAQIEGKIKHIRITLQTRPLSFVLVCLYHTHILSSHFIWVNLIKVFPCFWDVCASAACSDFSTEWYDFSTIQRSWRTFLSVLVPVPCSGTVALPHVRTEPQAWW